MSAIDTSDERPGATAGPEAAMPAEALRALAAGVASVDRDGNLLSADDRFLGQHGIDHSDGDVRGRLVGRRWSHVMQCADCRLAGEDASALVARWSVLLKTGPAAGARRASLRLSDGRTLELAATSARGAATVLVVKDSTEVATGGERRVLQRGFVHDVNNTLGGMLANLYLATTDLEADHPARKWLDAVNLAAVDLRARVREIAGTLSGTASDKSRRR